MKTILYNFTRSLASGISLARITLHRLLPNLYILNTGKSELSLIYEGDYPNIYPQAYGEYLDRLGSMFYVVRFPGETDDSYRVRILFALRQNVTKSGIVESLKLLFSSAMMDVDVEVRESFTEVFDGVSTTLDAPMRSHKESLLYGITVIIRPMIQELSIVNMGDEEYVTLPSGTVFYRVKNNNYLILLNMFQVSSFRELLGKGIASGVKVNRVVVVEPSAGGSRYR